ncbi:MAG: ATP-grasp domain-containing protein [Planctomycetales bacterium]|nr:ATP-grasp domain-containing protein [Planctomycetales bacterium]
MMRILLSSIGRRGYLVKYFKDAIGDAGEVWGADGSPYAPAFQYCDHVMLLPRVGQAGYADKLLALCRKNKIDMVVPLIDPELEVLAAHHDEFRSNGVMAVVSSARTIENAFDKYQTYLHAKKAGIEVPETVTTIEEALKLIASGKLSWPVMVKPRKGSASMYVYNCRNEDELQLAFRNCPGPMIQQFVPGEEFGYDIFCDGDFKPVSVFCKRKLAMRAGETDKAVSVNDKKLLDLGVKIAQAFPMFGPADVDVKIGNNGPALLEINPRFGGGYPCSHLCGADFPAKLVAICKGQKLIPNIGDYPAGVYMFKQDEIISPTAEELKGIIGE